MLARDDITWAVLVGSDITCAAFVRVACLGEAACPQLSAQLSLRGGHSPPLLTAAGNMVLLPVPSGPGSDNVIMSDSI